MVRISFRQCSYSIPPIPNNFHINILAQSSFPTCSALTKIHECRFPPLTSELITLLGTGLPKGGVHLGMDRRIHLLFSLDGHLPIEKNIAHRIVNSR